MLANYRIRAPFFEFGPKAYLYGERLFDLVMAIDRCAIEYDVDVIVDPQPTDIRLLAGRDRRVHVYRQHTDLRAPGRAMGRILPQALREAGAEVLGIASIFTYGMQNGLDRLAAANVKNVSLSNFDVLAQVAAEKGYIRPEQVERLIRFRNNPGDESWMHN